MDRASGVRGMRDCCVVTRTVSAISVDCLCICLLDAARLILGEGGRRKCIGEELHGGGAQCVRRKRASAFPVVGAWGFQEKLLGAQCRKTQDEHQGQGGQAAR